MRWHECSALTPLSWRLCTAKINPTEKEHTHPSLFTPVHYQMVYRKAKQHYMLLDVRSCSLWCAFSQWSRQMGIYNLRRTFKVKAWSQIKILPAPFLNRPLLPMCYYVCSSCLFEAIIVSRKCCQLIPLHYRRALCWLLWCAHDNMVLLTVVCAIRGIENDTNYYPGIILCS